MYEHHHNIIKKTQGPGKSAATYLGLSRKESVVKKFSVYSRHGDYTKEWEL